MENFCIFCDLKLGFPPMLYMVRAENEKAAKRVFRENTSVKFSRCVVGCYSEQQMIRMGPPGWAGIIEGTYSQDGVECKPSEEFLQALKQTSKEYNDELDKIFGL